MDSLLAVVEEKPKIYWSDKCAVITEIALLWSVCQPVSSSSFCCWLTLLGWEEAQQPWFCWEVNILRKMVMKSLKNCRKLLRRRWEGIRDSMNRKSLHTSHGCRDHNPGIAFWKMCMLIYKAEEPITPPVRWISDKHICRNLSLICLSWSDSGIYLFTEQWNYGIPRKSINEMAFFACNCLKNAQKE